jgi:hypothetical protein
MKSALSTDSIAARVMRAIGARVKIANVSAGNAIERRRGVAREKAVGDVKPGARGGRRIGEVEPAQGRRHPAEQVVEHIDQQQPGEEGRQADPGGGDDTAEMVDPRIGPLGGGDAD